MKQNVLNFIAENYEEKVWTSGALDFTKGQRVMLWNSFEKQGGDHTYLDTDVSGIRGN